MLDEIGLLDERYFLYAEDIELCLRAMRAGWHLFINLDIASTQGVSTSLGGRRNPAYYYYITRNTLLLISERLTGLTRLLSLGCFAFQTAARYLAWTVLRRRRLAQAVFMGVQDFMRGHYGQAPESLHSRLSQDEEC
jgi:GT2 family glycosyltransferase